MVLASTSASLAVPCSSGAPLPQADGQRRGIKVHRYYARIRKNGKTKWARFSQDWNMKPGAPPETFEMVAHEKEAFEKFSRYAHDSREDASLVLSTPNMDMLPPMERFNQLIPRLAKAMKLKAASDSPAKMKATLQLCDCFDEYSRLSGLALDEMSDAHQREFAQAAEGLLAYCRLSNKHVSHQGAPAAALRLADVADQLRCTDLRDRALAQARVLATGLDARDDVPVRLMPESRNVRLKGLRGSQLGANSMSSYPRQTKSPRMWADSGLTEDNGDKANRVHRRDEW